MARVDYSGTPDELAPTQAPDAYERIQANPAAFGAGVSQGAEALGQGAIKAGEFFGQVAADNASNWFQTESDKIVHGDPSKPQLDADGNIVLDPDGKPLPDLGVMGLKNRAAMDAAPIARQKIEELQAATRGTLTTPEQKLQFDNYSRRYQAMLQQRISGHVDQQAQSWYGQVTAEKVANGGAMIAANPADDAVYEQGLHQMMSGAIRGLQIAGLAGDKDAVASTQRKIEVQALETRIRALAPRDPHAALAVLNDNQGVLADSPRYDSLTNAIGTGITSHYETLGRQNLPAAEAAYKAERESLPAVVRDRVESFFQNQSYTNEMRADREERRLQAAQEKAASATRVGLSRSIQNATAMITSGYAPANLPGDDVIRAAFPNDPARAEEVIEQVGDMRDIGGAVAQLPNMSPQDIAAKGTALRPDPADPTAFDKKTRLFNIWSSAVKGHVKALEDDPAGTVLGNPAAHPEITGAWSALQTIKDPTEFSAAFGIYADATMGTQAYLGVPENERSVLPAKSAQAAVAAIEETPETAPAQIKQIQHQYGASWPTVWRDLVSLGKLSPKYQAVGMLDDERDGAQLARWIQGGKDTKRNVAELVGGDKVFKGLNDAVDSSPDLMALSHSLYRSGASQAMVGDVIQSVKDLAYAKAANGETNSAESALHAFTSRYEFMPNGGARIPAKVFDVVTQNAEVAVNQLKPDSITIPRIFGQQGMPKPEEYLDLVRSAPTWITSPTADSIMLMDPYGRFVRDAKGNPVQVKFDAPAPPPQHDPHPSRGRLPFG